MMTGRGGTDDVAICIRTYNEARHVGLCLQRIREQETSHPYEVLILDSGSTDDTTEIASAYGCRIERMPQEEFNYGNALNRGVSLTNSEYFVALSAHAIPRGPKWLEELVRPVAEDDRVAGAFSRQVPAVGASPFDELVLWRTFRPECADGRGYDFRRRRPLPVVFSNASSCLRRQLVREYPFSNVPYAEDREWAAAMQAKGFRVTYAAMSIVAHSHRRTLAQWARCGRLSGEAQAIVGAGAGNVLYMLASLATCPRYALFYAWLARLAGWRGASLWVRSVRCAAEGFAQDLGSCRGMLRAARRQTM